LIKEYFSQAVYLIGETFVEMGEWFINKSGKVGG